MPTFRTSQPGSAADPGKPHFILVGLPGSGKTTIGRAVAERMNRTFLDLDQEIERREGRTIAEIFAQDAERHFRKLERELTEELALVGNMILAPGGGWAAQPGVLALLRPPGKVVYLKVRPETAIERLGTSVARRPLLTSPNPAAELERLLMERRSTYETADFVVDTELYKRHGVIEKVTEFAAGIG